MSRILQVWAVAALLLADAGIVRGQEAKPAPITVLKESGPVMYGRSAKIKAVVDALDLATREITLKGPKGRPITMRVEDRVKNLPDIKIGDEVVVRYHESVGVELRLAQEGETVVADETVIHAEAGQKPAATSRKTAVARVESVGQREKSVVLKTPEGRYLDLYVRDAEVLESLKTGDTVVATYTDAAVVSVEGPKEKDPKDAKTKKKPRKK